MYYRISFKTWLNASRHQKTLKSNSPHTPFPTDGQPPEVEVFIEVEETIEYTSEENGESCESSDRVLEESIQGEAEQVEEKFGKTSKLTQS